MSHTPNQGLIQAISIKNPPPTCFICGKQGGDICKDCVEWLRFLRKATSIIIDADGVKTVLIKKDEGDNKV